MSNLKFNQPTSAIKQILEIIHPYVEKLPSKYAAYYNNLPNNVKPKGKIPNLEKNSVDLADDSDSVVSDSDDENNKENIQSTRANHADIIEID